MAASLDGRGRLLLNVLLLLPTELLALLLLLLLNAMHSAMAVRKRGLWCSGCSSNLALDHATLVWLQSSNLTARTTLASATNSECPSCVDARVAMRMWQMRRCCHEAHVSERISSRSDATMSNQLELMQSINHVIHFHLNQLAAARALPNR